MSSGIKDIPADVLRQMYGKMALIRQFEERIHFLFLEGVMPGTIHLYMGQEAVAAGVCANLLKEDVTTSTHRPHGHALAKGVTPRSLMAELFAKTTGCCKGKGGSMHAGDMEVGALPAIAIVGGGIPVAAGVALAFKFQKKPNVCTCFFGDGASNEGAFHEGINMASIWDLPVVFVCENNRYGASTSVDKVMRVENVADRAAAYGIPGEVVDGNDVVAVYRSAKKAIDRARAGKGPTLLECKTYRRCGHSRSDGNLYREKQEQEEWMARDPIEIAKKQFVEAGIITADEATKVHEAVEKELDDAVEFAKASPSPRPEDVLEDVFA